jgi:predicted glycosyltransferase
VTERARILIWVQHLLGSGHLRRALAIASALAESGLETAVLSGGPPLWAAPAGVRLLQLPPIRSRDARFSGLVDESGREVTPGLWMSRRRQLLDFVKGFGPSVVMTEMYPFGRRAFRDEVMALLDAARSRRALIISSVRDVLVSKGRSDRWAETRDIALARYHRVLIHGDRLAFSFDQTFPYASAIADRLTYTGFVLAVPIPEPRGKRVAVLVSAGGGAVGHRLLATALAARRLSRLRDRPWHLVGGANLPVAAFAELEAARPVGVSLDRQCDDLPVLMASADVSVSQAGYNTVAEGLAGKARLVLVPFDGEGQDEQRARAARLAELGLATMLAPEQLSPEALAAVVDDVAQQTRPDTTWLSFDGARRTAAIVRGMLATHAAPA